MEGKNGNGVVINAMAESVRFGSLDHVRHQENYAQFL